jgi:hypothetical protein
MREGIIEVLLKDGPAAGSARLCVSGQLATGAGQ